VLIAYYFTGEMCLEKIMIYHGSFQKAETPEIGITKFNKDFYYGFYCTI